MFYCHNCGSTQAHLEYIEEVFVIDGKHVLVKDIPAQVCDKCGEPTFSRETTERVRRIVHGDAQPVGTLELEVFTYQL